MFTELERIWITRMNINTPVDMEYHEVIRCHNVNRTFCTSKQTCHFLCSKLEKLSPSLPLQQATLNLTNEVFPNLEANSSPKIVSRECRCLLVGVLKVHLYKQALTSQQPMDGTSSACIWRVLGIGFHDGSRNSWSILQPSSQFAAPQLLGNFEGF